MISDTNVLNFFAINEIDEPALAQGISAIGYDYPQPIDYD